MLTDLISTFGGGAPVASIWRGNSYSTGLLFWAVYITLAVFLPLAPLAAEGVEGERLLPNGPSDTSLGRIKLAATETPTAADMAGESPVTVVATDPAKTPNAEPEAPPKGSVPPPIGSPSPNVVINLINRLVQRGLLTKEDSDELIEQANIDTALAIEKQVLAGTKYGAPEVPGSRQPATADDGAVTVNYVPEFVKDQMREQIKQEVMKEAKEENWAAPNQTPEWTKRIHLMGDVRLRYQGDLFPGDNAIGATADFHAINTGDPFDFTGANFNPTVNVDENRHRIRLRARAGAEFDLTEGFTTGLRVGTGESNSPVSQNQSLGKSSSSGGGQFSNYGIWLDRAFIKYEAGKPDKMLAINLARFDNPFFSPTELMWDNDLGFDGVAFQGKYKVAEGFVPFGTLGGFPIYNSDFNFASNQPDKFKSEDKWLVGGQVGADIKLARDFNWKIAGAFYHFENVEGRLSSPFIPLSAKDAGDTDGTRPSFAQKGNTYRTLRNIDNSTAANGFGANSQFQYFGLATPFDDVVLSTRLDYSGFEPFHIWFQGEFVKNIAYDKSNLSTFAVNNLNSNGSFDGGDMGWTMNLNLGNPILKDRWDWNLRLGYRYVESDAVIDGFTDSDFGGGGTNMQGYGFGGNLLLSPHVSAGLNWMSADSISGPALKQDVIQLDITAKF